MFEGLPPSRRSMPNYLKMPKQQHVIALLELGWSYRRIQTETGVRRETVGRYDRARQAKAAKVFPGSPPQEPPTAEASLTIDDPNAAKAFAGSESNPANVFPGSPLHDRDRWPPRIAPRLRRNEVAPEI